MKFRVTVTTLSPLHIGSGQTLLADFDYVSTGDKTYVLNQDWIFERELKARGEKARLDRPAGQLIDPETLGPDSQAARYWLQGGTSLEQIHEQIKDVFGRVYLPGSSLKGALRTALLAALHFHKKLGGAGVNYEQDRRGNYKAENAARNFERSAFRPSGEDSANVDIMRLVQVADSAPIPVTDAPLALSPVRVFTKADEDPGPPIAVEVVRPGMAFEAEIKIDELLLQYSDDDQFPRESERLDWGARRNLVFLLPEILQQYSLAQIRGEIEAARRMGFDGMVRFYESLEQQVEESRGRPEALLQLGWGTGWMGTTIGPYLDGKSLQQARTAFNLGKPPRLRGEWTPGDVFPKSRRLGQPESRPDDPQACVPLGWLHLVFEPVGAPLLPDLWDGLSREAHQQAAAGGMPIGEMQQTPPEIKSKTGGGGVKEPDRKLVQDVMAYLAGGVVVEGLVESFSQPPKPGDRFMGTVFAVEAGRVMLEIPGLDPDYDAYAVIALENAVGKPPAEEEEVVCEVISMEEEPGKPGYWKINCRRLPG